MYPVKRRSCLPCKKSDGFEPNLCPAAVTDDNDDNRFAGMADAIGREAPRGRPGCSPTLPANGKEQSSTKAGRKRKGNYPTPKMAGAGWIP
jgi:hypothetical protein